MLKSANKNLWGCTERIQTECQYQFRYPALVLWVHTPQIDFPHTCKLPAPAVAVRRGKGRLRWHPSRGLAWPFQPSRVRCTVRQLCGPGKVRRVRLDQCVCPAAWRLWSVPSVRGEVEQAGRPSTGALWRSKPLSAVLLSCFGITYLFALG